MDQEVHATAGREAGATGSRPIGAVQAIGNRLYAIRKTALRTDSWRAGGHGDCAAVYFGNIAGVFRSLWKTDSGFIIKEALASSGRAFVLQLMDCNAEMERAFVGSARAEVFLSNDRLQETERDASKIGGSAGRPVGR